METMKWFICTLEIQSISSKRKRSESFSIKHERIFAFWHLHSEYHNYSILLLHFKSKHKQSTVDGHGCVSVYRQQAIVSQYVLFSSPGINYIRESQTPRL